MKPYKYSLHAQKQVATWAKEESQVSHEQAQAQLEEEKQALESMQDEVHAIEELVRRMTENNGIIDPERYAMLMAHLSDENKRLDQQVQEFEQAEQHVEATHADLIEKHVSTKVFDKHEARTKREYHQEELKSIYKEIDDLWLLRREQ